MKEKRDLLARQIIILDAKALVTGQSKYVRQADKKLEEYRKIEKQIIGGMV